jgi:beta-xylosidase
VIDRSSLATAVRNTFEFSGVTGKITLDAFGDRDNVYQELVWHDPFGKSTLNSAWSWVDEDPTHWSLTARPGFLRIITQDPYPNRLIRPMPGEDFQIRTRLLFEPYQNFQFAGLLVFLDQENYLQFGRAFAGNNGIFYDHIEGGDFIPPSFGTFISETDEVYLQLTRHGNTFTAYASGNGTQWIEIGSHTIGFKPVGVGLFANNQLSGQDEINADFDFFLMEYQASQVFLPLSAHE